MFPVHRGHPFDAPMLGMGLDALVDLFPRDRSRSGINHRQIAHLGLHLAALTPERLPHFVRRLLGDIGLEQASGAQVRGLFDEFP